MNKDIIFQHARNKALIIIPLNLSDNFAKDIITPAKIGAKILVVRSNLLTCAFIALQKRNLYKTTNKNTSSYQIVYMFAL